MERLFQLAAENPQITASLLCTSGLIIGITGYILHRKRRVLPKGGVTGHDVGMMERLMRIGDRPGVNRDELAKRIAEMENENLEERGQ